MLSNRFVSSLMCFVLVKNAPTSAVRWKKNRRNSSLLFVVCCLLLVFCFGLFFILFLCFSFVLCFSGGVCFPVGDENPQDEHQGVRGAGAHVHPPAHRHLPGRVEDLPVLQRAHQPSCGRAGAVNVSVEIGASPLEVLADCVSACALLPVSYTHLTLPTKA